MISGKALNLLRTIAYFLTASYLTCKISVPANRREIIRAERLSKPTQARYKRLVVLFQNVQKSKYTLLFCPKPLEQISNNLHLRYLILSAHRLAMATQETAKTEYINAANGITFAFRRLGSSHGVPLVMEIHFRANMDFWDPLLVNNIAAKRSVIILDRPGVGRSDGKIRTTYNDWGNDVISFAEALGLEQIDLLGFSMGGCSVQMAALNAPHLIRKLIICGSGPSQPSEDTLGILWPREEPPQKPIQMLATATTGDEMETTIAYSFFPNTRKGREAAKRYFARIYKRTPESCGEEPIHSLLGQDKSWEQRKAYHDWSTPNPRNSFDRLGELNMPVLVLNGDDDLLIPTSRSYELLKRIDNAQLILYPQAGHGFLWQYAERVAADINTFLDEDLSSAQPKL